MAERPGAGGRLSKYDPLVTPALARQWAAEGLLYRDIAKKLGVSPTTLYAWKRQFPEFLDALGTGEDAYKDQAEQEIVRLALGYTTRKVVRRRDRNGRLVIAEEVTEEHPGNFAALAFYLRNRAGGRWKAHPEDVTAIQDLQAMTVTVVPVAKRERLVATT